MTAKMKKIPTFAVSIPGAGSSATYGKKRLQKCYASYLLVSQTRGIACVEGKKKKMAAVAS